MLPIKRLFDYLNVLLYDNRCFLLIIRLKRFLALFYFKKLFLIEFHTLFLIINLIVKKEQTLNEPEDLCNVCSKNIRVKIPFVFFPLEFKKTFVNYTRINYWQIFIISTLQKLKTKKRLIHLRSTRRQMRRPLIFYVIII